MPTTLAPSRTPGTTLVLALADKQILAAYQAALAAENDYALKAVICGYMLLEKRASLAPCSHSGKTGHFVAKNGDGFLDALEAAGMSKSKAYRWMEAAERVGHCQLNVPLAMDLPSAIDVEGVAIPLSQALTAPEKELPAEALKFRQGIFEFMADKTLSDALNASLDGESPAHRITRAHAGKTKGGKGQQDRKQFEKFATEKIKHLTTFVTLKKKVAGKDVLRERPLSQNQKAIIITRFTEAMTVWPRWLVGAIVEQGKNEWKTTDVERAARPDPFSGRNV